VSDQLTSNPSFVKRFANGFSYGTRSLSLLKSDAGLKGLTAVPVLLTALSLMTFLYWTLSSVPTWLITFLPEVGSPWIQVAEGLVWVVGLISAVMISFLGTLLVSRIIGLPFYSFMAERSLKLLSNEAPPPLSFSKQISFAARMFFVSLLRTAVLLPVLFLLVVASLIPGVQLVAAALSMLIAAFDFSDYALEAKGIALTSRFKFLKANFYEFAGFSVFVGMIFFIPIVNVFLLPLAVLGGSVLVHECSKSQPQGPLGRYNAQASDRDLRVKNKTFT